MIRIKFPKKIKIGHAEYTIIITHRENFCGDDDVNRIASRWDPGGAKIYIADDLDDKVKNEMIFYEIFKIILWKLGFDLYDKDEIVRPVSGMLLTVFEELMKKKDVKSGINSYIM